MEFDLNAWERGDSSEITFSDHQKLLKEEVCQEALRLYQPQVANILRPVLRGVEQDVNETAADILTGTELHFNSLHTTKEMANLDESLRRIQNEHKEYPGKWRNAMLCIVAPSAGQGMTHFEDTAARHCQIEEFCKQYAFIHTDDQIVCTADSFDEAAKHIREFLMQKKGIVNRAIIVFNGHGADGGLSFAKDRNLVLEDEFYKAISDGLNKFFFFHGHGGTDGLPVDNQQNLYGEDKFLEAMSKGLDPRTLVSMRKLHVVFAQCFSHTLRSMKNLPFVSVHVFPLSTPKMPSTTYKVTFEASSDSQEKSGDRRVTTSTHTEAQSFAKRHSSTILKESLSETLGDATASDVFTDKDETLMDEACALPGGDSSSAQPSFHVEPME